MKSRTPTRLCRVGIVYPSGNTSAIVFDQLPKFQSRSQLNNQLMESWQQAYPMQPPIEQCAIVTTPRNPAALARVEMLGGEFCGNATRGALWLLTNSQECQGKVEVSGTQQLLSFAVRNAIVELQMPILATQSGVSPVTEGTLINFDGISQLVVREVKVSPRTVLTRLLQTNAYNLAAQPAVGVTYYSETTQQAQFCVWVKNVATIFDETACGSGTSAIGIAMSSLRRKSVRVEVIQPSGKTICAEATYQDGRIVNSMIAGKVAVLYDGEFSL